MIIKTIFKFTYIIQIWPYTKKNNLKNKQNKYKLTVNIKPCTKQIYLNYIPGQFDAKFDRKTKVTICMRLQEEKQNEISKLNRKLNKSEKEIKKLKIKLESLKELV